MPAEQGGCRVTIGPRQPDTARGTCRRSRAPADL